MRKIFTLFMAMSLSVICMNAAEVTLWEGTYTENIEINKTIVNNFIVGDVLRVYATVPEGGANFKLWYSGTGTDWAQTTIPSMESQWPWINGDATYYDLTFTDADITALKGNNIYIAKGDNSTITRVSAIMQDLQPGEERELWSGSETLNWNEVAQQTITTALLGNKDQLIVTVSAKNTATEWPKVLLRDASSNQVGSDIGLNEVSEFPYEAVFTLTEENVTALQGGVKLCGDGVTVTKLVLKKYKGGTTAIDNTNADSKAVKLIRDGQVFILRDNKTYTLQGQLIK